MARSLYGTEMGLVTKVKLRYMGYYGCHHGDALTLCHVYIHDTNAALAAPKTKFHPFIVFKTMEIEFTMTKPSS